MSMLFLSSYFTEVAELFASLAGSAQANKTVAFIPTAGNTDTDPFYVAEDAKSLEAVGLTVDMLDIAAENEETIRRKLANCGYIFVAGGNTFYLLQEMKRTGAGALIAEHIARGKTYIGSSAGSILLAPNIGYIKSMDDCTQAPDLDTFDGLAVVDFFPLPHYKNEYFNDAVEGIIAEYSSRIKLMPITNSQAIVVMNGKTEVLDAAKV